MNKELIEADSPLGDLLVDLKSCPFCGADMPRLYKGNNHANCLVYWVECGNYEFCKVRPHTFQMSTAKAAIKVWETRK